MLNSEWIEDFFFRKYIIDGTLYSSLLEHPNKVVNPLPHPSLPWFMPTSGSLLKSVLAHSIIALLQNVKLGNFTCLMSWGWNLSLIWWNYSIPSLSLLIMTSSNHQLCWCGMKFDAHETLYWERPNTTSFELPQCKLYTCHLLLIWSLSRSNGTIQTIYMSLAS